MVWILLSFFAVLCACVLFWRVAFSHRPKMNRRIQRREPFSLRKNVADWRANHLSKKPKRTTVETDQSDLLKPTESADLFEEREELDWEEDFRDAADPVEKIDQPAEAKRQIHGVVVIYLIAPVHQNYRGYELLQALLTAGLRFGSQKIFHRYQDKQVKEPILFSLASIQKPGTFEISRMGAHHCPGLVLFMTVDGSVDHLYAFELMIETAKQLEEDLGGELFDEHHQPLSPEVISKLSENIERFEYEQRAQNLFG